MAALILGGRAILKKDARPPAMVFAESGRGVAIFQRQTDKQTEVRPGNRIAGGLPL